MILDTNALSAMADGDGNLERLLAQATEIALPTIVLGEYRFGIRQSRNHRLYERWLDGVLQSSRVLTVDENTAEHYAGIREELKQAGRPMPGNDLWIAALGRQYGSPLVSRDQHFDFVQGLRRVTW